MFFTRPGRHWQNPVLFCHFWEIRYHSQTGNTKAKFKISLRRGRIAGQFLHWNFEGKNPNVLHLTAENGKISVFWRRWQIKSFFVTVGKLRTSARLVLPQPSFEYHYKEEGLLVSFCFATLRVNIPNFLHLTAKNQHNWHVWALLTKSSPLLSLLGN